MGVRTLGNPGIILGTTVRRGIGVPSNSLGIEGDYYLNLSTSNLYSKQGGVYTLLENLQGVQGLQGLTGLTGKGISSIVRTLGTGAAGTTDTYTITFSDATTTTFQVVNGANGTTNIVQSITSTAIATAHDLSLGNIVNVTDNLSAGDHIISSPTMPSGVKVGDKFEYFFHKLLATACTVTFTGFPNITYTFNNGTDARVAFEWSGTRLLEAS